MSLNKKVVWFLLVPSVILLILFIGLQIAIYTDKPPTFFPVQNPEGSYTVLKSHVGNLSCKDIVTNAQAYTQAENELFVIKYKGPGVFQGAFDKTDCIYVYIGKSPLKLDQYVGREVNVNGEFRTSDKQCIEKSCSRIGTRFVVFNIKSIRAQ